MCTGGDYDLDIAIGNARLVQFTKDNKDNLLGRSDVSIVISLESKSTLAATSSEGGDYDL